MLSPFRFFRTRPDDRIRIGEDDTNYDNLLNTAVTSDAEDEETDYSNNNLNNTNNRSTTTSQNHNPSNQEIQNNFNSNDIFGDFTHFNNMNNYGNVSSSNNNNNNNNNNTTENANTSKYDAFNFFGAENKSFSHLSSNGKRIGSTGDIDKFLHNSSKSQDNTFHSSISESQIFTKVNDSIDLLGLNNPTVPSTGENNNKGNNNDIFGDFNNVFGNTPISFNTNEMSSPVIKDNITETKNSEFNNQNADVNSLNEQITNINEDDNDLFGDFNSHDINTDDDGLFDDFTPVIAGGEGNPADEFFNVDFAGFSSMNHVLGDNNNTNNQSNSNLSTPLAAPAIIKTKKPSPTTESGFDAFNLNSPSSSPIPPVSYDFFSNYNSKNKYQTLNNKISFDTNTDTNDSEYDDDMLLSPMMSTTATTSNSNKKNENKENSTKDKTNNTATDSIKKNDHINSNQKDGKENGNSNNNINDGNNNGNSSGDDTKDNNKGVSNTHGEENKNKSKLSKPSTPAIIPVTPIVETDPEVLNRNRNNSSNRNSARETPKESGKKKVQTPIKLKNADKIKNDHISSSDTRIKLSQQNEPPVPKTPTNVKKIETILDLPPDILLRIITFVSLESLPKVAQLCRRFKLLVYNDAVYEQKLRILGLKYISTEQWIAMNKVDTQKGQGKGKRKSKASELNYTPSDNFLPDLENSNFSSGYSASIMKINELNSYLQANRKNSLEEDIHSLGEKNNKSIGNLADDQNKKKNNKNGKDKNGRSLYSIDSDFNIFAKEEEYEKKKSQSTLKSNSSESMDTLNGEPGGKEEGDKKKEDQGQKDNKENVATSEGQKEESLTVDTKEGQGTSEKKKEKGKPKEKRDSLSPQAKLQMSFMQTPREVFRKECSELLHYYLDFKHPIPYKYLIFEDYTNICDIARILRRLVNFSKGRFVSDWQVIQENIKLTVVDFEDLLQSEFEENYTDLDMENLSNIAKAYQELNGGGPLVQTYLSKCQLFYDPKFNIASLSMYKNNMSHPSLSSTNLQNETIANEAIPEPVSPLDEGNDLVVQYTSFVNRLISAIGDYYYQIKAIFPYESDALYLFLQKIIEDIISDYLNTIVDHARRLDSAVYVMLLTTFVQTTMNIVEVIEHWDEEYEQEHPKEGSKFTAQAIITELQSVMEPFTQYYIHDEVEILKKQYQIEIDKWKQERERRTKAETGFLDGDVESYKRNVMKTFKSVLLAPAVMTKNLMGKGKNKDNAQKEKNISLDDQAINDSLSLELSLNLIHMNKEALKRCQLIMDIMNDDVGKCAIKLFIVLLKYLDTEHIAPSFELATKQLATNENHGTQNIINSLVTFFELIHIADLIQQMVHVYYMEDISKYVDENDFMSDIIVEKKQFERHLDDLVAQGMDKSIQVLIDNIEYTLINELPLDAYNIQSNHQVMDLKPTKACLKVVEFLSYHSKMITGVTDKNTINVLYEEISIRLFNIFIKNLKRMQINLLGAGQLICDLNQYCIWASTLRNPATTKIFGVLKEVGNLFIVDTPQDLKRIVLDTDRYGGYLRRDDIDDLLKCRTDYKDIQHIIETKDCIIQ